MVLMGRRNLAKEGGAVGNAIWDVCPLAGFLPFSRRFSGFIFRVTLQKVCFSYGGKLYSMKAKQEKEKQWFAQLEQKWPKANGNAC